MNSGGAGGSGNPYNRGGGGGSGTVTVAVAGGERSGETPIVAIIAGALRQAGIDADVDLSRHEATQTIRIRVLCRNLGTVRTVVYSLQESALYVARDPVEYVRNLVEYVLRGMDRQPALDPKIWKDQLLNEFDRVFYKKTMLETGGAPPSPPPTAAAAPVKLYGPRILDLDGATAEPKPQPKRQIDV